jgi:cell wall-associated NlpC family hydrolase
MRNATIFCLGIAVLMSTSSCNTIKKTEKSGTPTLNSAVQLRKNVIQYAQKYVGSPYKYGGESPSGFDCSGFTSYVLKKYGVKLSPASAEQAKQGVKIPLDRARQGDLLFFGDASRIQHVALIVEHKKEGIICVHSTTSRGVIIENVTTSSYWKPKILYARDVISK